MRGVDQYTGTWRVACESVNGLRRMWVAAASSIGIPRGQGRAGARVAASQMEMEGHVQL